MDVSYYRISVACDTMKNNNKELNLNYKYMFPSVSVY